MVGDARDPNPWPNPCPRPCPRLPSRSLWSVRPGKGGVMYGRKECGTRDGGRPAPLGDRLVSLGFGLASLGLVRFKGFSSWFSWVGADAGVGGGWAV